MSASRVSFKSILGFLLKGNIFSDPAGNCAGWGLDVFLRV